MAIGPDGYGFSRVEGSVRYAGTDLLTEPVRAPGIRDWFPAVRGKHLTITKKRKVKKMAQTQADRSAAAQKAAVTRERNRKRAESEAAGKKAAGTRQSREAGESLSQAQGAARDALKGASSAARFFGDAVTQGAKAVATKAGGVLHEPNKK